MHASTHLLFMHGFGAIYLLVVHGFGATYLLVVHGFGATYLLVVHGFGATYLLFVHGFGATYLLVVHGFWRHVVRGATVMPADVGVAGLQQLTQTKVCTVPVRKGGGAGDVCMGEGAAGDV